MSPLIPQSSQNNANEAKASFHLRLGQVCYEVGELDRAANELTLAYMAEGRELFEDDDPRYWEFLRSRIRLRDDED